MKLIVQEMKKIIRPLPIAMCLIILILLTLSVPKNLNQAKKLLDTDEYPEKFTLYDDYSVDILFHDFLLERYGNQVTTGELDEIIHLRSELLEQIDVATQKDEILLRTGTLFNRESAQFYSSVEPMGDTDSAMAEQDQIYVWSCINGQMKLDGTDYPIGYLSKLENVILTLQSGETYHVLPCDVFSLMRKNISIVIGFVVAAWILVIPYGVAEAKSGTQLLAFSTKKGRFSYIKKIIAASLICLLIIGVGVVLTASLYYNSGAYRYYESDVGSAIQSMNLAIASGSQLKLVELYAMMLGMTAVIGLASSIIITHLSLQFMHAISAIASSLPVILAFAAWCIAYTQLALDFGSNSISYSNSYVLACVMVLSTCIISAGFSLQKYKQNY